MDGRTGSDFRTWYGFSVRIFFSTVLGTDFDPDSNLVRYGTFFCTKIRTGTYDLFSVRYVVQTKISDRTYETENSFEKFEPIQNL